VADVVVIGTAICQIGDDWCRTTMADGSEVVAMAEDTDAYRQTAADCGYGTDTDRLCIEHELIHSLLARWLGLSQSYTLTRIAHGNHIPTDLTRAEEHVVLGIQAFANAMGVSIRDLAR
jgi:hypothetical protein